MKPSYLLYRLQGCEDLSKLKQIHSKAIILGFLNNSQHLASKLLTRYSQLGHQHEAVKVFDLIPDPDIISWTCLFNHFLLHQNPRKSLLFYSQFICRGFRPDSYSIVAALSASGRSRDLRSGKIVHCMVFRFRLDCVPFVGNSLIDMYSRNGEIAMAEMVFKKMERKDISSWTSLLNGFFLCGDFESACYLFGAMPQRNVILWTAMITGCIRGKNPVLAFQVFQEMIEQGKDRPTAITFVSVLSGCADIGAFDFGQSVHAHISKTSFNEDLSVNNALMDMYVKCGKLDSATKKFDTMLNKDVFSWTTMISGYAYHGQGYDALETFSMMLESGTSPNDVTFLSVLSACSHAGLVLEGQKLFSRMTECYGIKPRIEHYGCLVDLLGRAGLLKEAKTVIDQMPVISDAVIWKSFLNSCLIHGDSDLAEVAGNKVIELEPDDDGAYALVWNMHFAANRQANALKTRKLMRNRKVKKKPGISWVEVNGTIHEFLVEDRSFKVICFVLEGIRRQATLDVDLLCSHIE